MPRGARALPLGSRWSPNAASLVGSEAGDVHSAKRTQSEASRAATRQSAAGVVGHGGADVFVYCAPNPGGWGVGGGCLALAVDGPPPPRSPPLDFSCPRCQL